MTEFHKFIVLKHVAARRKDQQLDHWSSLRSFVLHLFDLTPLLNLHSLFYVKALRLATFYFANLLFVMGISFLIYANFFRNAASAET